jgi:hypothetical protein
MQKQKINKRTIQALLLHHDLHCPCEVKMFDLFAAATDTVTAEDTVAAATEEEGEHPFI